ncbi:MAG: NAD+ synthase [Gammaproteobacteria bacterium]
MTVLVCAQLNLCVGDTAGNLRQILTSIERAKINHDADLIIFSELTLTGYPPEDLLYRAEYLEEVEVALKQVQEAADGIAVVVGHPYKRDGKLYNTASVFEHQKLVTRYEKQFLPNMQVFDERRYFEPGYQDIVVELGGIRYALAICEDIWHAAMIEKIRLLRADVLLVMNASPFSVEKPKLRHQLLSDVAAYLEHPVVYVNQVGGQDELVFDGGACAFDRAGKCISQAPWFEECLWPVTLAAMGTVTASLSQDALMYQGIVLATRDYCTKNRFKDVTLGLSGGIDSSLCLAILNDALGPEHVHPIFLPSRYSSALSRAGAQAQCKTMGITLKEIPIDPIMAASYSLLESIEGALNSVTLQNIQSRARAMLLMGVSNQTGAMLISTGNKSEYAMGYTTLYGDMAGGFAPLKDVYKVEVYRLAAYRNGLSAVIPQEVIDRPPSAELAPNQVDEDDLPPYPLLDAILKAYLEGNESLETVIKNADPDIDVTRVIRLLYRNEYKRRQAPPGPKLTSLAFGKERRYPMTSGFHG